MDTRVERKHFSEQVLHDLAPSMVIQFLSELLCLFFQLPLPNFSSFNFQVHHTNFKYTQSHDTQKGLLLLCNIEVTTGNQSLHHVSSQAGSSI